MSSPTVLLDSAADIDFMQAGEVGVNLLMQTAEFDGQVWLDAQDLTARQLSEKLRAGTPFPRDTPCSVDAYAGTLERLLGRHSHVLALHPAGDQGSLFRVAQQAAERFGGRVSVLGSQSISAGMALEAQWAAQELQRGGPLPQVLTGLKQRQQQAQVMVNLDTTEFLKLSPLPTPWLERVPEGATVVLGTQQGQVRVLGFSSQVDTTARIMRQRLRHLAREYPQANVAFFHHDGLNAVNELMALAHELGLKVHWVVPVGLTLAALCGPGAYSFAALTA